LFGDAGLSLGVMTAIFGLLLLFAAFFSAVLLVITSCARSFKEAQAYLIPLMLVALAPGVLSLMPGLELSGLLLVTPLANIVLLGRDLFAMKATAGAALTVVGSTLLYAGAAIGLAARIFGGESVLYSSQPGWSELLRRPAQSRPAPTLTAAAVCLAVSFPLYFLLLNLAGRVSGVSSQLMAGIVVTVVVFGLMPLAICWMRRVPIGPVFRIPPQPLIVTVGVLLAAVSLWMFDQEAVVRLKEWQQYELDPRIVEHLRAFAEALRNLPLPTVLLALAIVPAVFEELFFRGFLFGALRAAGGARIAIVVSAIVFGLFHWISPNPFAAERVLSSTLTGCALGWVRWRTGSLLPGMLLHIGHNGLLALLLYFEPQLAASGIGVTESSHLPGPWLAIGAMALVAGGALVYVASRGVDAEREA
jgi:ABC-2 type transport system permease protein/sodium transport system permease protein